MKIINDRENYKIYSDSLKTFDKLPAATYRVDFAPMSGFSLTKVDDFTTIENKIYGNHLEKISKALSSYDRFERSLGIILSGNKGMGKSLFVQLLAKEVIEKGMPVIMVTKPYNGVAEFIETIDQEALIVFEEFEKVFNNDNEQGESQNNLLGLFDGTSQKKRLYVITVNNLYQVSEFMLNRTGRFHYHIRFNYPTANEIDIYLRDKLEEQYYPEIKHVIMFANRVKLNYDSLRAIAFELNCGYSFRSAISDLNILTTDAQQYDIKVNFTNGKTTELKAQRLDLFSDSIRFDGYNENDEWFSVIFDGSKINAELGDKMIVNGTDVHLQLENRKTNIKVTSVEITHHIDYGVNYRLTV